MNVVLITSVIYTVNTPLSNFSTRSVYTPDERFQQTLKTIESVKTNISNAYIILIEASKIDCIKEFTLQAMVDLYLNYADDVKLLAIINGTNKSFAEGCMLLKFLESDELLKLNIENLFKLSGRYYLNEKFNEFLFLNQYNCFKLNEFSGWYTEIPAYYSFFYKIHKLYLNDFVNILRNNVEKLKTHKGDHYHMDMEHFLCTYLKENVAFIDTLGISGNTAVNGNLVDH